MLNKMKLFAIAGALATAATATTGAQAAGWIVGLVDGKSIVTIDPATRKVASKADIKGAEQLVGIDVRPADGMLYGIAVDGSSGRDRCQVRSGRPRRASCRRSSSPTSITIVDFNPVADRIRVMSSDGTSLRVNPDDGKATVDGSHKYKEGDANAAKKPKVVAGAYTNSWKGTKATDPLQHRCRNRCAGDAGSAE